MRWLCYECITVYFWHINAIVVSLYQFFLLIIHYYYTFFNMKKILLFLFLFAICCNVMKAGFTPIIIHSGGANGHDHNEHYTIADMPDAVYY